MLLLSLSYLIYFRGSNSRTTNCYNICICVAVTAVADVVVVVTVPDLAQWKQQQDNILVTLLLLPMLISLFLYLIHYSGSNSRTTPSCNSSGRGFWLGLVLNKDIIAYDINKIWKFDQSPRQNSFSGRILFSMRM